MSAPERYFTIGNHIYELKLYNFWMKVWRFFHPTKVVTRYRVEYTGKTKRNLEKQGKLTYTLIDRDNDYELLYMLRVCLGNMDNHYRVFEQYHDGTEREIKMSRFRRIK